MPRIKGRFALSVVKLSDKHSTVRLLKTIELMFIFVPFLGVRAINLRSNNFIQQSLLICKLHHGADNAIRIE